METFTKHFTFRGEIAFPTLDLFLHEAGWADNPIIKSSASKVSEYSVYVRTFNSMYNYKLRNFSVNEMEADFNSETGELRSLVFRDTSVHKKISFTKQSAVLTVVKGADTVGQNSESLQTVNKEPIIAISINGKELKAPFDIDQVYTEFTGLSTEYLTEEEIEEEKVNANLWAEMADKLKEEGWL